ncbi:hypothetical protein [Oerskovia paurometabola]|uniref:Lipoprotein n=1 Tax=Oerskovia paurometabola TaxID=162170 RepID=A0ABW1XEC1_9CELL|nr:hypothetical protein [Oerskovia paurometabola]MBM7497106.1 hypothetical protein [Oerskovia paurometabola]
MHPTHNVSPHESARTARTTLTSPRARRIALAAALVVGALALAACAPGPNPDVGTPTADGSPAGFWLGLWQGVIVPVTFVVSLFTDTVNIYEVHNNGNWYDFGFVLGLGLFVGGPFGASRGRRHH